MKTLKNAATDERDYSWVLDGTECWASAYEMTKAKDKPYCRQVPVLGLAHRARALPSDDPADAPRSGRPALYFTAYRNDLAGGPRLSSRTVSIRSRDISTTREEAMECYDDRVKNLIAWHEKQIQKLTDDLLGG